MYIVKRPFRDASGMVSAGSVVEPADIKRFKHRLLEGHIVEVNEHNFEQYKYFFKERYGVEISMPSAKPAKTAEPVKPTVAKAAETVKPTVAKASTK